MYHTHTSTTREATIEKTNKRFKSSKLKNKTKLKHIQCVKSQDKGSKSVVKPKTRKRDKQTVNKEKERKYTLKTNGKQSTRNSVREPER